MGHVVSPALAYSCRSLLALHGLLACAHARAPRDGARRKDRWLHLHLVACCHWLGGRLRGVRWAFLLV